MTTKRKSYSTQFKIDAVKVVTEGGCMIKEASRNLAINPNVLRRWEENKRLRMERGILKKPVWL